MSSLPSAPALSVVLTTYNGGRFIRQQLASLAAQTRRPQELLVCDDGSTDNTLEIVTEFQRSAPFPVSLQRNPTRLGYSENFLHGCSLATGAVIAFCDQDDVWKPTKLERCVAALAADPGVVLAMHSAEVVDAELRPRGFCKPDFRCSEVTVPRGGDLELSLPGFAMVFSADLVRRVDWRDRARDFMQPDTPLMAHDQWIVFLARSVGRVAQLSERLVLYRQHGRNSCGAVAPRPPAPTLERSANESAYRQRAVASEYYSEFLTALASTAGRDWENQLRECAGHYHRLGGLYATRAAFYRRDHSLPGRMHAYARLWQQGAYRSARARARGLGWRAAVKDAGALVLGERNLPGLFR